METTKIKITPSTVSGSTDEQADVAKLTFSTSSITSSLPLFVNGNQVLSQNQALQFDANQGIMRVGKVYVQDEFMVNGQKPILQSGALNVTDGVVSATSINVSGSASVGDLTVSGARVLTQNQFLTFNDVTGTLNTNNVSANEIRVRGNEVLASSPDLSWDPSTGTLIVKNLKVLGTMDISNV